MATSTTKPSTETKDTTSTETNSLSNVEKTIQEHTPIFVSKTIISTTNALESFRLNYFNSQFIFYPILIVITFFVFRFIWNKVF